MANQRKPSEIIEDFLNLIERSHEEWKNSKSQVDQFNNNTFRWTHDFEDADVKSERNKLATGFHRELKERRKSKDNMCLWEHVHKFGCDEQNKPTIKRLRTIFAKQKISEEYVDTPPKNRELKGVNGN